MVAQEVSSYRGMCHYGKETACKPGPVFSTHVSGLRAGFICLLSSSRLSCLSLWVYIVCIPYCFVLDVLRVQNIIFYVGITVTWSRLTCCCLFRDWSAFTAGEILFLIARFLLFLNLFVVFCARKTVKTVVVKLWNRSITIHRSLILS